MSNIYEKNALEQLAIAFEEAGGRSEDEDRVGYATVQAILAVVAELRSNTKFPRKLVFDGETGASWIYDPDGAEPAFELKWSYDGDAHAWHLEVSPMHMDGTEEAATVIIAR